MPKLRVAVIGGLSRASGQWVAAGVKAGFDLEHHDGKCGGRGPRDIAAAIRRSDVVVILTDTNSHIGVGVARKAAAAAGRPFMLVKRLRPDGIAEAVAELQRRMVA